MPRGAMTWKHTPPPPPRGCLLRGGLVMGEVGEGFFVGLSEAICVKAALMETGQQIFIRLRFPTESPRCVFNQAGPFWHFASAA